MSLSTVVEICDQDTPEGIIMRDDADAFEQPEKAGHTLEDAAVAYNPDPGRSQSPVVAVRERNEKRLLAINGVVGVAIGRSPIGEDALVVYLRGSSVKLRVPSEIEGYPVETVVTGPIDAYPL